MRFGSAFQLFLCSTLISHAYPGDGRRAAPGAYNFLGDVGMLVFLKLPLCLMLRPVLTTGKTLI